MVWRGHQILNQTRFPPLVSRAKKPENLRQNVPLRCETNPAQRACLPNRRGRRLAVFRSPTMLKRFCAPWTASEYS
jgi:hypothetical protein